MVIKNGITFVHDKEFCRADLVCDGKIREIRMKDDTPENEKNLCSGRFPQGALRESAARNHNFPNSRRQEDLQQEIIDASGKYVIPGLIDIHTHGAVNADASDGDAEGMRRMAAFYASRGVTSCCPTTMTLPEGELLSAMHAIRSFAEQEGSLDGFYASCLGVHLEGPFLSAEKKARRRGNICKSRIWNCSDGWMRLPAAGFGW